jgi:hypothetical protein
MKKASMTFENATAAMASEKTAMISKKAAKAVRIPLTAPLPHQINHSVNFYSL